MKAVQMKSFVLLLTSLGFYSMMMMFTFSSIMYKWMSMEIYTFLVIFFINKYLKKLPISLIYYYMISSIFMIFMVYLVASKFGDYLMLNYFLKLVLLMMFMMKLGMYPFSWWFLIMMENLPWYSVYFMMTFMKLMPLIFMREMEIEFEIILVLLVSSGMTVFESTKYYSIKKVFACSSILQNFIFIILLMINKGLFMMYAFTYTILLYLIIVIFSEYEIHTKKDLMNMDFYMKLIYLMFIVCYMMLPPLMMFMLKWNSMIEVYFNMSGFIAIMIFYIFMNLIMMWNYFNLIKFIFTKKYVIKTGYTFSKKHYLYMYIIFMSLNIYMSIFMSMV